MANDGIDCTPEHPFLIRRRHKVWHNDIRRWRREFYAPEWVEAKDLSKDTYLGVAINQNEELPKWEGIKLTRWKKQTNNLEHLFVRESFWYLMGRYVGDGWKRQSNGNSGIVICCGGRNRDELVKAMVDCYFNYTAVKERSVEKFHIASKELCEFVSRYGYYAHGKKIDAETMNLPIHLLKAFIEGYEDSDGCVDNTGLHKVASVSKELMYGIGQCIAKVYHIPYKIYKTNRPETTYIEGRLVHQRDSYQVYYKEKRKQDHAFYEDGYIWFPISKIETYDYHGLVYNMEVENDNSYTANGAIVHNCQDFSNAGLQAGGEEGSGTRSSLLWEVKRCILAKHPKYLLMENVKALVSEKFRPTFLKWCDWLTEQGYTNFAEVINSKDQGCPQNRERIFVVSTLDHSWFNFPQKKELKTKLKDLLEEKVDERYYLDDRKVAEFIGTLDKSKIRKICE